MLRYIQFISYRYYERKTVGTDKVGLGVRVSRVMNSSASCFCMAIVTFKESHSAI
jgi:hypothetical protein